MTKAEKKIIRKKAKEILHTFSKKSMFAAYRYVLTYYK